MKLFEVLAELRFERVVIGNPTGRFITIVGGAHGNERVGSSVALSLAHWLTSLDIHGQVIVFPFASPEALHIDQREYNGIDMNRQYDTKKLPPNILNRINQIKTAIEKSMAVIDAHGASHSPYCTYPFVYCTEKDKKYAELFHTDIEIGEPPEGSLRWYAAERSIPCITIEGIDNFKKETIKIAMIGLYKILKEFKFV